MAAAKVASAEWVRKLEQRIKDIETRFEALAVTPSNVANFKMGGPKPTLDLVALNERLTTLEKSAGP